METGQRLLLVLVFLVLFAPLAYTTNFLFGELGKKWGVAKFLSALSAYTFVSFIFYVWLFLKFRIAGLVVIYLLLVAQTVFGLSRFREEFKEQTRNTLNGLRKKQ
jgi:fatty acid desaturase